MHFTKINNYLLTNHRLIEWTSLRRLILGFWSVQVGSELTSPLTDCAREVPSRNLEGSRWFRVRSRTWGKSLEIRYFVAPRILCSQCLLQGVCHCKQCSRSLVENLVLLLSHGRVTTSRFGSGPDRPWPYLDPTESRSVSGVDVDSVTPGGLLRFTRRSDGNLFRRSRWWRSCRGFSPVAYFFAGPCAYPFSCLGGR